MCTKLSNDLGCNREAKRLLARSRVFLVAGFFLSAVVLSSATSVIAPAFNQLVGQADYIVRAVVKSVTSELRTEGTNRHIITKVELDVREVISGTPPTPLVLQMLGGKVGTQEMVVEGAPKFKVGDEDILFVHGNGHLLSPLVALMYGRYPIQREAGTGREYVARSNGVPLMSEQEVSRPMTASVAAPALQGNSPNAPRNNAMALSPSDFATRIKAAVASNSRPKSEN